MENSHGQSARPLAATAASNAVERARIFESFPRVVIGRGEGRVKRTTCTNVSAANSTHLCGKEAQVSGAAAREQHITHNVADGFMQCLG